MGVVGASKLNTITRIFDIPTRIHPIWYLILYIAAVPFFGFAYTLIPRGFYAPYAQLEPYGQSDAYNIGALFQSAIRRAVIARQPEHESKGVLPNSIYVQRLHVISAEEIGFDILVMTIDERLKGTAQLSLAVVTTSRSRIIAWKSPDTKPMPLQYFELRPSPTYVTQISDVEGSVFSQLFPGLGPDYINSSLPLSDDEAQTVDKFFAGINGDPNAISGNFWRLFYFSAIVITTVGFGDIVPMIGLARLLVALEALFGITTLGLFLNALAYRASLRSDGNRPCADPQTQTARPPSAV